LRGHDARVPRLLEGARQRPLDADAAVRLRRPEAGDRWCLCAERWKEALDAGSAPQVVLEATHAVTLQIVPLDDLKKYAVRLQ
jgi:uncharacterized protein (DUF2237 family)